MKANKVTVTLVMESLSVDCLRGLVTEAVSRIEAEFTNGELVADDGDVIRWKTESRPVEF